MKILFVATIFPIPPRTGASVALLETLRSIEDSCELHLLVPQPPQEADDKVAALQQRVPHTSVHFYESSFGQPALFQKYMAAALTTLSGRSYHAAIWMDKNLRRAVWDLQGRHHFNIVHCEWLYAAIAIKGLDLPVVVRTLDLHSVIMRDGLKKMPDNNWLRKSFWQQEAARFRRFEIDVLNDALLCIALSPEDEDILRREGVSRLVCIPPPMALQAPVLQPQTGESLCNALFLCALHDSINRESSFLFTDEIWPLVSAEARAQVNVIFAGGRPDEEARRRAAECGIHVHAPLSDDEARKLYAEADIFISPVKTGTGIKTKAQEAMANGKPMIGFPNSFRGIPAQNGVHAFIVTSNEEFARKFEALIADPKLRRRVGESARDFIDVTFNPKTLGHQLMNAYFEAVNGAAT